MSMWSLPPFVIDLLAQLRLTVGVYDPGFIRSRTALRGLIAIMSACFATWLIAWLFAPHLAIFTTLAGGLASYSASLRVQDPSRRARLVTYLLMIPTCWAGILVTITAHDMPLRQHLQLIPIVGLAFLASHWGVRASALGFALAYLSIVLVAVDPGQHTLYWLLGSVGLALLITAAVQLTVLQQSPTQKLRQAICMLRPVVAGICHDLIIQMNHTRVHNRRFHALDPLNNVLELTDGLIVSPANDLLFADPEARNNLRLHLSDVQRAAESLLTAIFSEAGDNGEALRSLRVLEAQAGNPDLKPEQLDGEPAALWHARRALLVALDALDNLTLSEEPAPSRVTAAPQGHAAPAPANSWVPAIRMALMGMAASALAYGITFALHEQRPRWAMLAAFLVCNGGLGDTMKTAVDRILATLAGILAGMTLSHMLHGNIADELVALYVFLWVSLFIVQRNTRVRLFWVNLSVAQMYALVFGNTVDTYVEKIADTAIGALAAVCMAILILPRVKPEFVRLSRQFFDRIAGILMSRLSPAADDGSDGPACPDPNCLPGHPEVMELEKLYRALADHIGALRHEALLFPSGGASALSRQYASLVLIKHYAVEISLLPHLPATELAAHPELITLAAGVKAHLERLERCVAGEASDEPVEVLDERFATLLPQVSDDTTRHYLDWLQRLDSEVLRLQAALAGHRQMSRFVFGRFMPGMTTGNSPHH